MLVTESVEFYRLCCSECAVVYYFPEKWTSEARRIGRSWNCPNGHNQWFGESDTDKLRRERDKLKQQEARLIQERIEAERERDREAEKRAKAERETQRIKKRAASGVCPCCSRHFTQLERHMQTEHPDIATIHCVSDVHAKVNKRAAK